MSKEQTLPFILEGAVNMVTMPDYRRLQRAFKERYSKADLTKMEPSDLVDVFTKWDRMAQPIQSYSYVCDRDTYTDRIPIYIRFEGIRDGGHHLHVVVKKGIVQVPSKNVGPASFCQRMDIPWTELK